MATKKTRAQLDALWITGYKFTESDCQDLFLSVHLDEDGVASYANTVSTIKFDNPLRGNAYGSDSAPLTGSVTLDVTSAQPLQSAIIYHNDTSDPFSTLPSNSQKWNYTYTPGALNIITLIYHSSTLITISCRSADSSSTGAPYATAVSFTGTMQVGQTLTGVYTYNDDEGDAEGNTTFRWLRTPSGGSTFDPVAGAINQTYVLQSGDLNYDFRFEVTPVAASGTTLIGEPVQSATRGPVIAASWTETDLANIKTYLTFTNDSLITPSGGGAFVSADDANLTTTNGWEDASSGSAPTYDDANNKLTFVNTNLSQIRVATTKVSTFPALNEARTFCAAYRSQYSGTGFTYLLYVDPSNYIIIDANRIDIRSGAVTYRSTGTVANIGDQQNHILIVRSDSSGFTEVRFDGNVIPGDWTGADRFNFALNTSLNWSRGSNSSYSYNGDLYKIIVTTSRMSNTDVGELETKWLSDYGI